MNYFGAINVTEAINTINTIGLPRVSLYPQGQNDQYLIQSMKRGNRREQTRNLPTTFNVANRRLPIIRQVA